MLKRFKILKDQRGLTLIELLVVVVILGIIAGIAVPSVGGLIENSRKDAMVGNAQQAISAAKLYVASTSTPPGSIDIEGDDGLVGLGYLEPISDPWGDDNLTGTVEIDQEDNGTFTYSVSLTNGTQSISGDEGDLDREDITVTD